MKQDLEISMAAVSLCPDFSSEIQSLYKNWMDIEINFLHYEGNAGECLLGKVHMQELEVTIENTS